MSARSCRVWKFVAPLLIVVMLSRPAIGQVVALTFDDLPAHESMPPGMTRLELAQSILNTLKAAGAPPVYGFVNAEKLNAHPENIAVLKAWRAAGYPLGNHTYSHPSLSQVGAAGFDKEIAQDEPLLQSLMGADDWRWFRYPYLDEGNTASKRQETRAYLKEHGYRVAQVTLDFADWSYNAPYARCATKNNAKEIEWLKSTYLSSAAESIARSQELSIKLYGRDVNHVMLLHLGAFDALMLPQLIDLLKQKGFKLVTLQEAESDPVYESDPNVTPKYGMTLLDQAVLARHLTPASQPSSRQPSLKAMESICK